MKSKTKWIALAVGLTVLGGSIGRAIMNRKAQQGELAQSAATVQSEVMVLGPNDAIKVSSQPFSRTLPVSGSLTAQRSAIVKAKVAAELLTLLVREGDKVTAGQVIGQLDAQEFNTRLQQASQQAASAKAQWQIAQQTLDNNQALVKQGFISRNALDTSLSNAAATRATFDAAQAAVDLAAKSLKDTVVRAPINGLISQRFVQAGERVGIDARIVEVVDLSTLELQAPLSQQDVTQIKIGATATLHIDGIEPGLQARVARINPSATADTRAVMVYLSLTANPALRQGLYAQGQITLDKRDVLAIPSSAVTKDSGQDQVLRITKGKVLKAKVTLGPQAGTGSDGKPLLEVIDGLQLGDHIARNASGTMREGQAVRLDIANTQP
ncbi:MAG: efflux RND transporter periplasmic adaptor subunit [Aquabacterium sp.]|nr:efflux RND transporter periplasmic adaptor subunit [Aquabacterium sp.]